MSLSSRFRRRSSARLAAAAAAGYWALALPLRAQEQPPSQTPPPQADQPGVAADIPPLHRALLQARNALVRGEAAGSTFEARQALDFALKLFRTVRVQNPEVPDAIYGMAECLRLMGRGGDAIPLYVEYIHNTAGRAIFDADKTLALSHKRLGELYLASDYFKLALKELLRARDLNPADAEVLIALARCDKGLAELDQALEYAQLAVATDRSNADAHRVLAEIQLKRNDHAAADNASRMALELVFMQYQKTPVDPTVIARYAEFSRFRVEFLKKYLSTNPENVVELAVDLIRRLEDVALLEQRLALHEIHAIAMAAAARFPDDVRILAEVADLQFRLRMYDQGAETCRKILELSPGHPQAQQWLAAYEAQQATTRPARTPSPAAQPPDQGESASPDAASTVSSEPPPGGAPDE